MRTKFYILLMFVSVAFTLPGFASPRSLFPADEEQKVIGEGVVVVASSQTLDSAYDLAEKKAKLDASSQVGQYMEVVKRTDSSTREVKETVTSVNATLMQYEVIDRQVELVGANVVVKVKVAGKYKPLDMQLAMKKYFDNQLFREEVDRLSESRDRLQVEVENQRKLFNALAAAVEGNDQKSVHSLNKKLKVDFAKSNKVFQQYGLVLQQTKAVYIRRSGQADLERHLRLKKAREDYDSVYLSSLNTAIAALEDLTEVYVSDINGGSEYKTVKIVPGWKIDLNLARVIFTDNARGSSWLDPEHEFPPKEGSVYEGLEQKPLRPM